MRNRLELSIVVATICVGAYASYFTWYFRPQPPEKPAPNIIKVDGI